MSNRVGRPRGRRPVSLELRIARLTAPGDGGCVVWIGAKNKGYGKLSLAGGRKGIAHRVVWELKRGPIPRGMTVDHLCANRSCVNPDHMELVTPLENTRRYMDRNGIRPVRASVSRCPRCNCLVGDAT